MDDKPVVSPVKPLSDRFQVVLSKFGDRKVNLIKAETEGRLLKEQYNTAHIKFSESQDGLCLYAEVTDILQKIEGGLFSQVCTTIETITSVGVRYVFNTGYSLKVYTDVKRNNVVFDFQLYEVIDGVPLETPILAAHGGGLAAVVSVLLRIVCLRIISGTRQLLFLDESLAHLSEEHRNRAGDMIRSLARRMNIQVVMVTHDPVYTTYADKVYRFRKHGGETLVEEVTDGLS